MLTLRPDRRFSPHVALPRPTDVGPDPEPTHARLSIDGDIDPGRLRSPVSLLVSPASPPESTPLAA